MQSRFVKRLVGGWYIQRRVFGEKAIRLEHHADLFHGHNGEILNAGIMCEAECWK